MESKKTTGDQAARLTYTVGVLNYGWFRRFLNTLKLEGLAIHFDEGPGWLGRDFVIYGKLRDLITIKSKIERVRRA